MSNKKTWVIKIGSSILTNSGQGLAKEAVSAWVNDIVAVRKTGLDIVLVSSGAVAEGMVRLGLKERPKSLHLLQAAAATGQMGLIQLYESNFQKHQLHTAQVLLTHDDLKSRERYLNARSTLKNLLSLNVIPVVNENDTVVTDEIRFGDNDTLAALVANLMEAEKLILLTDQLGLYDRNPAIHAESTLIREAQSSDPRLDQWAGEGGALGRGGMVTKIAASRIAARSGASTLIAPGLEPQIIKRLAGGEEIGTLIRADRELLASRKRWLAGLQSRGRLTLDAGAAEVLKRQGRSLLPVGVREVFGHFSRGDLVSCFDEKGNELARGLINYNSEETRLLLGVSSRNIESILGYVGEDELIHRDNLVLI
ncbi:MAG: glutamate 5-kinase [Gammaproteobacteria bacterium]|nr:glutamate 5-kinase [Gammaproteobacteria bacterium]